MTTTPVLGATDLVAAQAIPETTVNETVRRLEQGAAWFQFKDRDLATPPGSPADGDCYLVATSGTGAWSGHDGKVAYYQTGTGWLFITPREGMGAGVQDENAAVVFLGGSWATVTTGGVSLTMASTVTQSGAPVATSVGFLGAPQMADQDDYTLALTDAGGHYYHVSGTPHTLTIPANGSIAFPIGTVIGIVNENGAGDITLAITTDTLRWGSSTGSRTIAANGTASLLKVTSTVWRLTGDGIT
jgi:hypothetical protein